MNIYLIGYRGTGKSSVAPLLAARLGRSWIDADVELERRARASIVDIFASQGEKAFRDLEESVLKDLAERAVANLVIATGGGVVLRSSNRRRLQQGFVVWLTAPAETILERLSLDPISRSRRPPLTNTGGMEEIRRLLDERRPLYEECANLTLSSKEHSIDQLVDRIERAWSDWQREAT